MGKLDRSMPEGHRHGARWALVFALAATLCTVPALTPSAHACGGFWCSLDAPVNQSRERILFVDHEDGTVSAVIEIQYSGPAERFAWLIPIPGSPEITVASSVAFSRLDDATTPSYQLERRVEGECKPDPEGEYFGSRGGTGGGGFADAGVSAPSVTIVDQGKVGPYDYVTIDVAPELSDPASAALEWFESNGYDFTGVDGALLRPYLQEGLNLLAFKLTKSADEQYGSIRPVILHYESERPMIPIRPTAVAAQDDMGVLVWVGAAARAVPVNYKSLVLNEARIDWLSGGSNYEQVINEAANEAGGQGFVTELAGKSDEVAQAVYSDDEAADLRALEAAQYENGVDALWAANRVYNGWDGWRDSVAAAVTLPAGVSLDQFASDPDSYRHTAQIDTARLFEALREKVVEPVAAVSRLLASRPYLTRLYTTMSAAEMTMDPLFDFNAELGDLSNHHVAKQIVSCDQSVTELKAPWRVELPSGDVVNGAGQRWPTSTTTQPANRRIEQVATKGPPRVVKDNAAAIRSALRKSAGPVEGSHTAPGFGDPAHTTEARTIEASDGCSLHPARTNSPTLAWLLAAALLTLATRNRRPRG